MSRRHLRAGSPAPVGRTCSMAPRRTRRQRLPPDAEWVPEPRTAVRGSGSATAAGSHSPMRLRRPQPIRTRKRARSRARLRPPIRRATHNRRGRRRARAPAIEGRAEPGSGARAVLVASIQTWSGYGSPVGLGCLPGGGPLANASPCRARSETLSGYINNAITAERFRPGAPGRRPKPVGSHLRLAPLRNCQRIYQ
jgi:hypothetical protein